MPITMIQYLAQTQNPKMKGLVQAITNESVFLKQLSFVKVPGFVYEYSREESLGGIAFRGLNEDYSDDSVGVINPQIESLARFGGEVKTDRAIANVPGGTDVRGSRIASKVKKSGLFYDKYVIQGDPATNPKAFYGLNARLSGNQLISAGANGAALTLAMVDDLIDSVVGTNDKKRLVMRKSDRRSLGALYRPSLGGTMERFITEYEGVPIDILDEDGDEQPILTKTEVVGSSGAACSSIYCYRPGVDADGEYMQGLVNSNMIEHEDQGTRGTQRIDLIEAGMGLGVFHARSAARLQGIL